MRPLRPAVLAIAAAALLPGCDDSKPAATNELADTPPARVLAEMGRALQDVKSYHVEGTETNADGRTSASADVSATGDARIKLRQGDSSAEVLNVVGRVYLRANESFWREQGLDGGVSGLLTDRWVTVPEGLSEDFAKLTARLLPTTVGYCLRRATGSLSTRPSQYGGRPVVILSDEGDRPGTAPGRVTIAGSGPPLPLRLEQTGRTKPGGEFDERCSDAKDNPTRTSDFRFSSFDEPVALDAPDDAVDLQTLLEGAGTQQA